MSVERFLPPLRKGHFIVWKVVSQLPTCGHLQHGVSPVTCWIPILANRGDHPDPISTLQADIQYFKSQINQLHGPSFQAKRRWRLSR